MCGYSYRECDQRNVYKRIYTKIIYIKIHNRAARILSSSYKIFFISKLFLIYHNIVNNYIPQMCRLALERSAAETLKSYMRNRLNA